MNIAEYSKYWKDTIITDEKTMLDSLVSNRFFDSYSQGETCIEFHKDKEAYQESRVSFRMMVSFSETFSPFWVIGITTQTQYIAHRIYKNGPYRENT